MSTSTRRALAILAVSLLYPATAHAMAWTQPAGKGYAKMWLRGIFGNHAFKADGSIVPVAGYQDVSVRYYVELGLTDKLTAVTWGTPAGWSRYDHTNLGYVGPLAVGLRRGFFDGRFRMAVEAQYGYTPDIGEENIAKLGTGVSYLPQVRTQFAVGELQAGYSFDWGWAVASGGLRWNSRVGVDSVAQGFVQVGWQLTETVSANVHAVAYEPFGPVEDTNVAGTGQTRYVGVGLAASWWVSPGWGLSAGVEGAPYAQSNAATPSFTLGVESRF